MDSQALKAEHCWFSVDRVPGDATMTAFKREARYRQALWRKANGLPMGSHANSKAGIETGGEERIPNGTRLDDRAAAEGRNFLSDKIRSTVDARIHHGQDAQTLDVVRLRSDLLSSMPMCFNLFGELVDDPTHATKAAELLGARAVVGPVQVEFEWSPGRLQPEFTNDRTAFDVALIVGNQPGSKHILGIETKYHEHATVEKAPTKRRLEHYAQIVERSEAFRSGWETLLGTDLQQIWRDHLLVLAMRQTEEYSDGRYILVFPARNTSFGEAAGRYRELLVDGDTTFSAMTVDELVETDVLHDAATRQHFVERYLW